MIDQNFEYFPSVSEIQKGIYLGFQQYLKANILNPLETDLLDQKDKEENLFKYKELCYGYT